MANPFKEAELRKQEEAKRLAEEAKKREAEEAKKREAEAQTQVEAEPVKTEENNEPAVEQEEVVVPVKQEAAPVVAATPEVPNLEEKDLATALREQVDADMDKMERKVAINVMIPPSLKRKMERDVRNKKFRSMSYLITALLREYYK